MLLASPLLAFVLLGAPATETDRMTAARTAYEADDFAAAVLGFESLAHDFPATARYHYYAGLARENAGQDTHAYFHMQVFLASGAGTAEEKRLAAERAAAIARRTTRVRLQLPIKDPPVVLRVTYLGPKSQATRPTIVVPLAALPQVDTRTEIALEPGNWQLAIDPAVIGDEQVEPTTITVTAGEPTAALRLKTIPAPQLPVELDLERTSLIRKKITVELRREGSQDPPLVLTTSDAKLHTTLATGNWTYTAHGRGFKPLAGNFSVFKPVHETLRFTSNIDDEERRRRHGLILGLLGSSVLTSAGGAVLVAAGVKEHNRLSQLDPESLNGTISEQFVIVNAGLGLLGATTGLWAAAASTPIRSRNKWIPHLVLGALMIAGGTAGYAVDERNVPYFYDPNLPPPPLGSHPSLLASAFVLGLGAGLTGGATLGYLSIKKVRGDRARASLHLSATPKTSSIAVRLSF